MATMGAGGGLHIDIRGDVRNLTRHLTELERKVIPQVTVMALNKSGERIRTRVVKRLAKSGKLIAEQSEAEYGDINLQLKDVRRKVLMAKASKHRRSIAIYVKKSTINAATVGMGRGGFTQRKGQMTVKGVSVPGAWGMGAGYVSRSTGRAFPRGVILKRVGGDQYPTEAIKIKLNNSHETTLGVINRMGRAAFRREFLTALEYKLLQLDAKHSKRA